MFRILFCTRITAGAVQQAGDGRPDSSACALAARAPEPAAHSSECAHERVAVRRRLAVSAAACGSGLGAQASQAVLPVATDACLVFDAQGKQLYALDTSYGIGHYKFFRFI